MRAPVTTNDPDETYGLTFYPGVPDISAAKLIEVGSDAQVIADMVVTPAKPVQSQRPCHRHHNGQARSQRAAFSRGIEIWMDRAIHSPEDPRTTPARVILKMKNVPSGSYDVQRRSCSSLLFLGSQMLSKRQP